MKLEYTHTLNQQDAIHKLGPFIETLKAQYGDKVKVVQEKWEDNVLKFRIKVKTGIPFVEPELPGTLTILDNILYAEAPVPSFAQAMEEDIRQKFSGILDLCFRNQNA